MADREELARLRISPSFGRLPLSILTLKLVRQEKICFVEATTQSGTTRKRRRIMVPLLEVTQQFDNLRKTTLPAFPVSPRVLDGCYVELTIYGEFSELRLGWWTIAPEGAGSLSEFAEWMQNLVPLDDGD